MKEGMIKKWRGISIILLAFIVAIAFMPLSPVTDKVYASGGSSMTTAQQLTKNKMIAGSCKYNNSLYYKFTTSKHDAKYVVKVVSEENDNSKQKDLRVRIYNSDFESLQGSWFFNDRVVTFDTPEGYSDSSWGKNKTYYIRIDYDSRYGDTTDEYYKYSVGVTEKITKPAKAKISSAKAGKKKMTVKWKAAKRATNYQIAYKKKGASKWTYKTTTKKAYKIKKLKSKKKYIVKVRGYKTVDGKKYYGAWSKTKIVKVK